MPFSSRIRWEREGNGLPAAGNVPIARDGRGCQDRRASDHLEQPLDPRAGLRDRQGIAAQGESRSIDVRLMLAEMAAGSLVG